jgi:methanethiol S-methyltransferase
MLQLVLLSSLYFALHSLLAANAVKSTVSRVTGLKANQYRVLYNLFNLAALIMLLILWKNTASPLFFKPGPLLVASGAAVSVVGLIIIIRCFRDYNVSAFLGFQKEVFMELNQKGLNRYIRHPLYTGTLLFVLGLCIAAPYTKSWLLFGVMLIYIVIGLQLEEKKLVQHFGDVYKDYQKKTKRLIPFIF